MRGREQVRDFARRSAKAAKEIKERIGESGGTGCVEQCSSIGQIGEAVRQLDQTVPTRSANSAWGYAGRALSESGFFGLGLGEPLTSDRFTRGRSSK
jgi:hypothetical protein